MTPLELSDRVAITDLLLHYSYCIDSGQLERLGEVFGDDADVDYSYGPWRGPDAVIAGLRALLADVDSTMHAISNVRVTSGDDVARATCYLQGWHWMRADEEAALRPADFMFTGVYLDELGRTGDGWRITKRRFRRLGPSALTVGAVPDAMRPQR